MRRIGDLGRNRRVRKGMFVLPSLFTAGNIAAGYYAIAASLHAIGSGDTAYFDYAAMAIGFAVVFDGLDGRIARMTSTTSDFGKQLDSLADVIAFGVAPAILAYVWGVRALISPWGADSQTKLIQLGGMVTFLFLAAGACRLARFNIQSNPQPTNPGRPGRKYFVGMPIPAGAGVIASVVHLNSGVPIVTWWASLLWMALVFAAGFLMVSTWRFYSAKDLDLKRQQPFTLFVLIAAVIAAVWFFSRPVLFLVAMTYMFSGILARVIYVWRRPKVVSAPEAVMGQPTESDLN